MVWLASAVQTAFPCVPIKHDRDLKNLKIPSLFQLPLLRQGQRLVPEQPYFEPGFPKNCWRPKNPLLNRASRENLPPDLLKNEGSFEPWGSFASLLLQPSSRPAGSSIAALKLLDISRLIRRGQRQKRRSAISERNPASRAILTDPRSLHKGHSLFMV